MVRRRRTNLGDRPRRVTTKKPSRATGSESHLERDLVSPVDRDHSPKPGHAARPVVSYRQDSEIRHCVVQPNDTLRSIAEREYGDEAEWTRVYQANRDVIVEPDDLASGQELLLP